MKVNCMIFCKLIKLLHEGTRSCKELADETGLHVLTVYQYTKEMHRQGLVHIALWEMNDYGRPQIKIYMWGPGKDAKRATISRAETSRRYKERKKLMAVVNSMVTA
jgi:predicted ArsR family transcriptional regulator